MYTLAFGILNNTTADLQVRTKIQRAINNRPSLALMLAQHQLPVKMEEIATGTTQDAVALRVDSHRVHRALEHVGRALYFHHFNQKWVDDIQVIPLFLIELEGDTPKRFNDSLEAMRIGVESLMSSAPAHGANPDVFTYQVMQPGQQIACIMLLRFYEGSKVVLLFKPRSSQDHVDQNADKTQSI